MVGELSRVTLAGARAVVALMAIGALARVLLLALSWNDKLDPAANQRHERRRECSLTKPGRSTSTGPEPFGQPRPHLPRSGRLQVESGRAAVQDRVVNRPPSRLEKR